MKLWRPGLSSTLPEPLQWIALLAISAALVALANGIRLPAALLIGPMIAGIVVGVSQGTIRLPGWLFIAGQGVIGCMIGQSIPLSFVDDLARDWPIFLMGIVSVTVAASVVGLVLTRLRVLPGTTAIWGTSPGASTSMIVMSEAYGGDIRLVAFMQNLRVISVAMAAALVAKIWVPGISSGVTANDWFPAISWVPFAATLVIAFVGAFLAPRLGIPAGSMLLPLFGVIALRETGSVGIELPPWLLAFSYALIGWSVGLRFTRPILVHAIRALPAILASILVLIAVCGLIAAAMVVFAGVEPLTAYLATSPGGLDSIAIIAVASGADVGFVMAMQTTRLLVVLVTSPIISRTLAQREERREAAGRQPPQP